MPQAKRILIIDDSEDTNELLWEVFKDHYRVFLASTACEGLNMLSKEIDLVFLDLILPDLDGFEVLKRIKNDYPSIPVIIITGYGTEERCIHALRLGARDYIKKPFSPKELLYKAKILLCAIGTEIRKRQCISMSVEEPVINRDYHGIPSIPNHILNGILKVTDYINKDLKETLDLNDETLNLETLDLNDACRMAGLNRTYFCKYFRLITGQTFQHYSRNIRLKRAKELLGNRNLRVDTVAEHIGYTQKYFSNVFKRNFGITPKESQINLYKVNKDALG